MYKNILQVSFVTSILVTYFEIRDNIGRDIVRDKHLQGRYWVNLRGGRRYICIRKEVIIHDHSLSRKCVAPLIEICP